MTAHTDPNPIVDSGAQVTIGGSLSAANLANELGLPLVFKPVKETYMHGWGNIMADPKPVVCTWPVTFSDNEGNQFRINFDIVEGDEPLLIGDNILRHSNHMRLVDKPRLEIMTPRMKSKSIFHTYSNKGESRPRLQVVPPTNRQKCSMVTNSVQYKKDLAMVQKVHNYSNGHAPKHEIRRLIELAKIMSPSVEKAINEVVRNCEVCSRSGNPLPNRKVSISNIDKNFNIDVIVDFFYFSHGTPEVTRIYFHARCCGVGYSEAAVAPNRNMERAASIFEQIWISRNGAPQSVGADPEFDKAAFKRMLNKNSIRWNPRPARRHSKVGIVERKNRVIKSIMERLVLANPEISAEELVARASFLSNVFAGSRIASSFEMARGYTPSIAGLPQHPVSERIVQAHRARTARRALQKLLSSHSRISVDRHAIKPGRKILIFDKDSKWHVLEVKAVESNFVVCRRHRKGPSLKVAYEDVRLLPKDGLDRSLLVDELGGVVDESETLVNSSSLPVAMDEEDDSNRRDSPSEMGASSILDDSGQRPPESLVNTMHGVTQKPEKDVGEVDRSTEPEVAEQLASTKEVEIDRIYRTIGHDQVTLKKLSFAPPWLMKESYEKEATNWEGAYEEMNETEVPKGANIVGSHVLYKIKVSEDNSLKLKARICPHGNEDREKDTVRKDSAAAQFPVIRLVCSIIALLGFVIAGFDIAAAYLQSGKCPREIYMRPPMEHKRRRNKIWKLTKLPYGIVEAGRQWQLVCEDWLINTAGFERVKGISQLFIKRHDDGGIRMIVAKVTDDFLFGGSQADIDWFDKSIRSRFTVGKTITGKKINFNGATINQEDCGDVIVSIKDYFDRIDPITISRERRKMQDEKCDGSEREELRRVAGQLNWAGRAAFPCASYAGSHSQQRIGDGRVKHLCEANSMLNELSKLDPYIRYKSPKNEITNASVVVFSDASFNIGSSRSYGQTGLVAGIAFTEKGDPNTRYHVVDWSSHKQRRVCYSSFGAEILACADADDMAYVLRDALRSIFVTAGETPIRNRIFVDSFGLWDTITTLHESREYRLRQTVQRIRDSFESKDLDELVWIPGTKNIADALTKRNTELQKVLTLMCNRCTLAGLALVNNHYVKNSQ